MYGRGTCLPADAGMGSERFLPTTEGTSPTRCRPVGGMRCAATPVGGRRLRDPRSGCISAWGRGMRARMVGHRRRNLIVAIATATAAVAVLLPALAFGHIERASYWPDAGPDTSVKPAAGGS